MKLGYSPFAFAVLAPVANPAGIAAAQVVANNAAAVSVDKCALLTNHVDFKVYGATLQVASAEQEYDQNQNHADKVAPTFSVDHTTITANGNTWSAYPLPQEVLIESDSVLQFDFLLEQDTVDGFQAVCLDEDTELTGTNGMCFVLRSSQGWVSDMINVPAQTGLSEVSSNAIPVGDFLTGPVNYLVFIQDSDRPDRSIGKSSVSGLKLISLDTDQLEIEIDDSVEYLTNDQLSYTMHLSEDRRAAQINGNQWKALPLNAPYDVSPSTVLEANVVVSDIADYLAVCLDADLSATGSECVVVQSPREYWSSYHH